MKRITRIILVISAAALLGMLFILVPPNLSSMRPAIPIQREVYDSLVRLQDIAVESGEFPVGAVVVYKDSIIGAGYNTFRTRNEPMGHAEINAIRNTFEGMHYVDFRKLSRDSLVLITSYEPCPMCKGVINHLDIRKIYYLRPKKFGYRFKYGRKELTYNLKTRRIRVPEDQ